MCWGGSAPVTIRGVVWLAAVAVVVAAVVVVAAMVMVVVVVLGVAAVRSEERRVGNGVRSRWRSYR